VDAGDEALVSDKEQGEARSLVDAAGFGFNNAVLNLIGHAEAVAAADAVGFEEQVDGRVELPAVEGDGKPSSKRMATSSRWISTSSRQNAVPMMGTTILTDEERCSRSLASWVAPRMLESVE
jgi:hypothetical protein